MQHGSKVTTIIENHVGVPRLSVGQNGLLDAPFIFFLGLPFPGEDRYSRGGNRGCGMILCREDIAGRPAYFSTQRYQCLDQHAGLNRHVNTAKNFGPCQRLRFAVLLSQRHERRHFAFCDFQFASAPVGEVNIRDLVICEYGLFNGSIHSVLSSLESINGWITARRLRGGRLLYRCAPK